MENTFRDLPPTSFRMEIASKHQQSGVFTNNSNLEETKALTLKTRGRDFW